MTVENQLLLALIKLRCNKDDKELAFFFGINQRSVQKIFRVWLNFLYFELKDLDMWLSRDMIDEFMPENFKSKFPSTRIIIDGTEIPIIII